jgi:hypothetical protein
VAVPEQEQCNRSSSKSLQGAKTWATASPTMTQSGYTDHMTIGGPE